MQFKYPELLYALLLLVVPILIHLFQLRRFEKVKFTNVKFLKSVKLQTRKSSQLKKWLTLLTRMLLLTCVVLAFAQPFIPNTDDFNDEQETVMFLDNSFSMQAKGKNGSLLNEAIQDIINTFPEDKKFSLFTNDKTYKNTTVKALKNDLINLKHSASQISYDAAILKGKQMFSTRDGSAKNLVLISDFQHLGSSLDFKNDSLINLVLVQQKSNLKNNVSIDSVYVSGTTAETLDLTVKLSGGSEEAENVTVSLFNNNKLISKSAIGVNGEVNIIFSVPNNSVINGKLTIEDAALQYDNELFFNINEKPKIKVLVIDDTSNSEYLKRIYTEDEFLFKHYNINALNYNEISDQNLIVLNELNEIPNTLTSAIKNFKEDGGSILIIPSNNIDLDSYNQSFISLDLSTFINQTSNEKKVTGINYNHPVLSETFYSKVTNFQYPKVNTSYLFNSGSGKVLSYEDGNAFLLGENNKFVFSASLSDTNSNFKNSPLIVPVFYNIGKQSLKVSRLFYTIGKKNIIDINVALGQDEILKLQENESNSVIPLQKTFSKSVEITTDDYPNKAAILGVTSNGKVLQNLSFNYNRSESSLNFHDIENLEFAKIENSVANTINTIKSNTNVNALWKWFVIFALAFLIIEMLILKYLK